MNVDKRLFDAEIRRQDDLRSLESHWRDLHAAMSARHVEQMSRKEAERLDSIRQVDAATVQRTADLHAAQALALAKQLVDTAAAADMKLAAALDPMKARLDDLTRAQYESVGQKTQVVETQQAGANTGLLIGLALTGIGLLLSFLGLISAAVAIYVSTR